MTPERLVEFRPRTIAVAALVLLGLGVALWIVWLAHRVFVWVAISTFLALAMQPAVSFFMRRGIRRRGTAAGIVYLIGVAIVAGLAAAFIPQLVSQINDLAKAAPGFVSDLTKGRGPLGFLETKYHVVEHVEGLVDGNGSKSGTGDAAGKLAPASAATALSVGKTLLSGITATITIAFMTFFMLLEGPLWWDRLLSLLPTADTQDRWRLVGDDIARTVSGYVTGNLLISIIAGTASAIVLTLLGVPFSLALGLVVAILDLIPLAGATLGAVLCSLVALTVSPTTALLAIAFFFVYQLLENHLLQPVVYGRTVQLSPLVVLIAILVGAQLGGVVGALGAIPVAGSIQIVLVDWLRHRQALREAESAITATAPEPRFTVG